VSGYPHRLWSTKLLVMLQAYIDDSRSQIGDQRLFFAGYVATADEWIAFSDAWDAALREKPAIDYFKMSEANGRGGCFRKFSVSERNKKVFRMAQVVKQFAAMPLHTSISTEDFNEIVKPVAPYPMHTPYFPLCYSIIHGVAHIHQRLGIKQKCDIIFDDHPGLANRVLPLFELFAAEEEMWGELLTGPPSFRDDKEVLPLQAADLFAWHVRRRADGVSAPDYKGILQLLTMDNLCFASEIDKPNLNTLADGFRSIPGIERVAAKSDWEGAVAVAAQLIRDGHLPLLSP
jgi:hypothetical protein